MCERRTHRGVCLELARETNAGGLGMLIDKSKFVVLVAAISAATGCVIVDGDDDGQGGAGGGTTSSTSQGGGDQGGGGTGGDATGGGGTGGDATGGGGAGGGESCLGDTGSPDACSSECEALDVPPDGISTCDGVQYLRAGVAEVAVDCLNGLNPDTCSSYTDGFEGCYLGSLAQACHDAAVEPECTAIATACSYTDDAAWQSECSAVLSGLTEAGRDLVSACTTNFCLNSNLTLRDCAIDAYYDYSE
jgi:hypothetical protein